MSVQYDQTDRFSLFENKRKTKDTQPTLSGSINVHGKDHFLDCWIPRKYEREFEAFIAENPGFFLSGKVGQEKTGGKGGGKPSGGKPRRELGDDQPRRQESRQKYDDYDSDSIPF